MKKTRKIKNKKLFLKWLKKSHKNKYNIVHSGGVLKKTKNLEKSEKTSNEDGVETIEDEALKVAKLGAAGVGVLAVGASGAGERLMDVAYSLASNDAVVSAVSGIGDSILRLGSSETVRNTIMVLATGTAIGTAVTSCGIAIIAIAIGCAVAVKIKERYSKYHIFIQSINNYILLLRKIDIMVKVAMKISVEYKFVIDTKDVVRALEFLLNLFEDLVTAGDVKEIKNKLVSGTFSTEKELDEAVKSISDSDIVVDVEDNDDDTDNSDNETMPLLKDAITRKENIFKRMRTSISSKYQSFKTGFKQFSNRMNQNKLSKKIDKGVAKLGLYFAVLLGEMNIILNVCQMGLIGKSNIGSLTTSNDNVKNDIHFKKMLVSSMIYRTLQLYNIFDTCEATKSGSQVKEIKEMCSPSKKQEHVKEVETERDKIYNVLFTNEYPLYAAQITAKNSNDKVPDPLAALGGVMKSFHEEIKTEAKANEFLKAIHDFDEEN